ncbi:hypothetical protein HJC99_03700 [Candidatus Saccharibacteria bacterium]|nr:hypothetical protein [Candidatus Saccharibacteria bacterium]
MQQNRQKIILAVTVAVIAVLGWLTIVYITSLQNVTITYDSVNVSSLTLYKTIKAGSPITIGKPVKEITSNKTYKIRNGSYVLRPGGDKTSPTDIPLIVEGSAVVKNLDIDYSATYLSQLAASETSAINAAIASSNAKIPQLYTIQAGYLYHHGEWYGTTLVYHGTDQLSSDTLRIVMHLDNGTWTSATNPPKIILTSTDNPTIPTEVLSGVNAISTDLPGVLR